MSHEFFSIRRSLLIAFASAALVACGAPPKAANAPAASSPAPAEDATPAKTESANEQAPIANAQIESAAQRPDGQLVCKVRAEGNAQELYLKWDGDEAKGTLRVSTPSGMVREEPVKAERYKARIVIDDPYSDDLAIHKATLVDDGKAKRIQIGDHTHPWATCN